MRHVIDWWMLSPSGRPWSEAVSETDRARGWGRYRTLRGLGARWVWITVAATSPRPRLTGSPMLGPTVPVDLSPTISAVHGAAQPPGRAGRREHPNTGQHPDQRQRGRQHEAAAQSQRCDRPSPQEPSGEGVELRVMAEGERRRNDPTWTGRRSGRTTNLAITPCRSIATSGMQSAPATSPRPANRSSTRRSRICLPAR